jgi:hypothetical protein
MVMIRTLLDKYLIHFLSCNNSSAMLQGKGILLLPDLMHDVPLPCVKPPNQAASSSFNE